MYYGLSPVHKLQSLAEKGSFGRDGWRLEGKLAEAGMKLSFSESSISLSMRLILQSWTELDI